MANSVLNFVFSSTCAIFGKPVRNVLDEDHPKTPINPYGRSKLMVETILRNGDEITSPFKKLKKEKKIMLFSVSVAF